MRQLTGKLRFKHLQLLVTLDRVGSLHAAAAELHLTQPTLSKALHEVESAFGLALFIRGARGMQPTAVGQLAIRGAERLLRELSHLVAETTAEPAGAVLHIGAPPFVALAYLPQVVQNLARQRPGVRVHLQEGLTPVLAHALMHKHLDALVTTFSRELSETAFPKLHYEKLFETESAVIAAPGHRLAGASRVSWTQLRAEPWVLPEQMSTTRRAVDEAFGRAGCLTPTPVMESAHPSTNLRLVAHGVGLSALPVDVLRPAEAAGEVVRLPVDPPLARGSVGLLYRAVQEDDPKIQWLREALELGGPKGQAA
ncbi:LysR family transcriptional regulator [Ottowia flava]